MLLQTKQREETQLSPERLAKLKRLHKDFPYYAKSCLKIRSKKAVLNPKIGIKSAQD